MSDNLVINPHSVFPNYSRRFPLVSSCMGISSRRPCVLGDPVLFRIGDGSKMPGGLPGAAQKGICSSKKSNIFYSKVFRKNTANFAAVGVELESNWLCNAVSLSHLRLIHLSLNLCA